MDEIIETQIQEKQLNAPRITSQEVDNNIVSVHYFTARDGVAGVCVRNNKALHSPQELELLTFCVLVLRNGFTVTGESACASPENFDAEIGKQIAYRHAYEKVWPLMGYELKTQLAKQGI